MPDGVAFPAASEALAAPSQTLSPPAFKAPRRDEPSHPSLAGHGRRDSLSKESAASRPASSRSGGLGVEDPGDVEVIPTSLSLSPTHLSHT